MMNIAAIFAGSWPLLRIYRHFRQHIESIAALCTVALIVWQRAAITSRFATAVWSLKDFYSAAFAWTSIQAGFSFGAYAFFLSRTEPFLQAISGSPMFMELRAYVRRTLYMTMALSGAIVPLLVATPKIEAGSYFKAGFLLFSAFSVALVYTVFCLLKVIRVFGKLEAPR